MYESRISITRDNSLAAPAHVQLHPRRNVIMVIQMPSAPASQDKAPSAAPITTDAVLDHVPIYEINGATWAFISMPSTL